MEAYKKGVDRTLLRANLKLTVMERFRRAMEHARFADELRRAGRELPIPAEMTDFEAFLSTLDSKRVEYIVVEGALAELGALREEASNG